MSEQIHISEDMLDVIIDRLDAAGLTELSNGLIALKSLVVGDGKPQIHKDADKFMLKEVIYAFGLRNSEPYENPLRIPSFWMIEDHHSKVVNKFTLAQAFESLIIKYVGNFDRSSKALCRTAIDLVLLESLNILKGYDNAAPPNSTQTGECTEKMPFTPYNNIQVYGELEFSHCIHTPSVGDIMVKGQIDYGIAPPTKVEHCDKEIARQHLFESLLVVVGAKNEEEIGKARPELLLYLGCLHQSHRRRGQKDTSVYGVESDGLRWDFVTITHDGTVRVSRYFEMLGGDIEMIMRCLQFMLKKSFETSVAW